MAEKLFPLRQRCKSCSKKLGGAGEPVHLGLYCQPRCAGLAELHTDPAAAPRECKTQREGTWVFKRRYRSEGEIPAKLREDSSASWYWCNHCGHLHIGRTLVDLKRAENRGIRDRAGMADLLLRSRGKATHKQVAQAVAVRPIRIKEWEDTGFDTPSMEVLFKLLNVYRVDLAAVFSSTSSAASR